MREELERTWEAWRDAVRWPKVAVGAAVLLLVGVLLGGDAVHGDTVARVALVPAALGGGYLVVALPRQTLVLRTTAFVASLALGRYAFGTPPPGREDTPPSLILNPAEFYAVHESLLAFAVLVVVAEPVGAWLVRPRREPGVTPQAAFGGQWGPPVAQEASSPADADPPMAASPPPPPSGRPDFSAPPGRPRPSPVGRRSTRGRHIAPGQAPEQATGRALPGEPGPRQRPSDPGALGGWSSPSPPPERT